LSGGEKEKRGMSEKLIFVEALKSRRPLAPTGIWPQRRAEGRKKLPERSSALGTVAEVVNPREVKYAAWINSFPGPRAQDPEGV
jgi:hypothetical protein